MTSLRVAALVAPLLAGVLAAPASAGTVSQVIRDGCFGDPACERNTGGMPVPVTSFVAAPGETNSVTVSRDGDTFLVGDFASPPRVVAPCTQVDATTARCPLTAGIGGIPGLEVDAGDGDDAVTVTGDPGAESILAGGADNDTITGGDGNDTIDGGLGNDRMSGGAGADTLSYANRTGDVTVSLTAGTGGETALAEQDTLSGFGTLLSGSGVDVLIGSPGGDTIDGGPGADNLEGRGGDDELFGNTGPDALRGGAGADRLFGDPTGARADDFLAGGSGDDLLDDTSGRNTYLGGKGRDTIEGGSGRDRVRGGPGNDRIDTRGGRRDDVDCGKGRRDRAKTDTKRDRRRRCERR